jgi:hypothetical protein
MPNVRKSYTGVRNGEKVLEQANATRDNAMRTSVTSLSYRALLRPIIGRSLNKILFDSLAMQMASAELYHPRSRSGNLPEPAAKRRSPLTSKVKSCACPLFCHGPVGTH